MPAVAGTARPPRALGAMRRGARHQWRARTCSATLYTSLQHARPPHTFCLGGSLNILLAAPECMVKGR